MQEAKYKIILTIRSRIEDLVWGLFPKNIHQPTSFREKMIIILKSGSPESLPLLEEVKFVFSTRDAPLDTEACIQLFADSVEQLFGKASSEGAHRVVDPKILQFLRNCSHEDLLDYLSVFNVQHDDKYAYALCVLSMRLPLPQKSYPGT